MTIAARLGIRPDELKQMIPSEFVLYATSAFDEMKRVETDAWQRNALLIASLINASPYVKTKVKWQRFMPKVISNKKQSQSDMLNIVKVMNAALGGKEVKHE